MFQYSNTNVLINLIPGMINPRTNLPRCLKWWHHCAVCIIQPFHKVVVCNTRNCIISNKLGSMYKTATV